NMSWGKRKVLVTGADGFIGSHLCQHLARAGAEVTALAQYNAFDSHGWLDDIAADERAALKLVRGDIRDAHQMMDLVQGMDTVFHLAALIAIPFSYEAPGSYIETNIKGTVNVLTASRQAGVRRIVNTSTSEVYGSAQFTPITEDHPLVGQSPYSASKIAADMMAESFYRSFGLPVLTLRPFNTYGPRQSERAVISTIIRQILDDGCAEIRLGDLAPERDFNFVTDTVRSFMLAADLGDEHLGATFNSGSGRMVSIAQLLEKLRDISGSEKPLLTEEARKRPEKSEVMALMADASRFNAASGWTQQVTLEEGLKETLEWWRGRMDRIRPDASYIV
ncbi:MAG: SDR family NAD(P)-dependent oxidoreductase, partial [Alphaproteobacteria bacterium]